MPERTITCPKYEALPASKRCRHYLGGGGCKLPDQFMCVEWLEANGHQSPRPTTSLPPARHAFHLEVQAPPLPAAHPTAAPATAVPATAASAARAPQTVEVELPERARREALSASDIDSFEALGVEAQLDIGGAEVHLVPAYTQHDRLELSVEHAATLRLLLDAFPGARVVRFERTNTPSSEESLHDQK